MTIKEVEERTGMARANIRFYESEGFISPERGGNGYRNYSERDIEILLRVKLLRTLEMPLEEIKQLHTGQEDLIAVLDSHIRRLEQQKSRMEQSQRVCREMRQAQVRYDTLDPRPYLDSLERTYPTRQPPISPALEKDVIPKVYSPWRRLFARGLDESIYSLIWTAVLIFGLRENLLTNDSPVIDISTTIVTLVLVLLLEPLMLWRFGTTPGKWIFGLRVTDSAGDRLTFGEAFSRTVGVLWYGKGFFIPVYQLWRQWKSYKGCTDGETLPWEEDSTLVLKDERQWRNVAFVVGMLAVFAVNCLMLMTPPRAEHRGELTVAEFSENYNYFAEYFGVNTKQLDERGEWITPDNVLIIDLTGTGDGDLSFETAGETVTKVTFTVDVEDAEFVVLSSYDTMLLTILAFAPENFSRSELQELDKLLEKPLSDWQAEFMGMDITCEVDYSGFYEVDVGVPGLMAEDGVENEYHLVFSAQRIP